MGIERSNRRDRRVYCSPFLLVAPRVGVCIYH